MPSRNKVAMTRFIMRTADKTGDSPLSVSYAIRHRDCLVGRPGEMEQGRMDAV